MRPTGKMLRRKVLPAEYIARRLLYLLEKARYDSADEGPLAPRVARLVSAKE